jgi:hypothetical protein
MAMDRLVAKEGPLSRTRPCRVPRRLGEPGAEAVDDLENFGVVDAVPIGAVADDGACDRARRGSFSILGFSLIRKIKFLPSTHRAAYADRHSLPRTPPFGWSTSTSNP